MVALTLNAHSRYSSSVQEMHNKFATVRVGDLANVEQVSIIDEESYNKRSQGKLKKNTFSPQRKETMIQTTSIGTQC